MTTYHSELLREILAGRRVVVASDVLVGGAETATALARLDVSDVLLLAAFRGTGELAPEVEERAVMVDLPAGDLMASLRAWDRVLTAPPAVVRRALDRFDPERRAVVVAPVFSQVPAVAGRPVFGARDAAWCALEDKTTIDLLWDELGISRAPSTVVPARADALRSAAAALDAGHGTVWVADNRTGWHGGAQYSRWVVSDGDAHAAATFLAANAERCRVMPFLEGRPCSIHGWVFDDHVAALRPCEMVVLREHRTRRLQYAGAATAWEPPAADRDAMRSLARRVGAHLRERVGYRGVFTIDGVLTADGFRPTELNPRFGGGLAAMARPIDLPIQLLHFASVADPGLDWRPAELEATVLRAADGDPVATAGLPVAGAGYQPARIHLARRDGSFEVVDEPADGRLEVGPAPAGGFLKVHLDRHPRGAAVAPAVCQALAVGGPRLGIHLPALAAAPDVR